MPQQEKITKKLDLRKRATITGRKVIVRTAHHSVAANESGQLLVANNSDQEIFFTLPLVNSGDGLFFKFFNINTAAMCVNSTEAEGAIFSVGSVNAVHVVNSVNLGHTQRLAKQAEVWGDGTRWLLWAGFTVNTDVILKAN